MALAIYFSSYTVLASSAQVVTAEEMATTTPAVIVASSTPARTNNGLQDLVKRYFPDDPTMVAISRCESRYRQYEKDGSVLRGIVNPADVGLFQINEYYHLKASRKLGFDIHTPEGNMAYAKLLRDRNGYTDWNASKSCWLV